MPKAADSRRQSPSDADAGRTPADARILLGRAAVALLVLLTLTAALRDAVQDRPAFLSGALFAVSTGVVVGTARTLRLPLPPFLPNSFGPGIYVPLILLRSSSWLLFAAEGAWRPIGLPALGDLPTALQAAVVVVTMMLRSPFRDGLRSQRMAFDGAVAAVAVTFALWVAALGRPLGYRVNTPAEVIGLLVVLLVVLETVTIGIVLVRDLADRPIPAFGASFLVGLAEIRLLSAGLHGQPRTTDLLTVALWCTGWTMLAWSACLSRTIPLGQRRGDALDRAESHATVLATVIVLGCTLVVLLAHPRLDDAVPGGVVGTAFALIGAAAFAGREVYLGRIRVRLMVELRTRANRDPLTGLANRRGLTEVLDQVTVGPQAWVVLALDLDGFKGVNDVHGHQAGDEVLVAVARVLDQFCPPPGVAARTGGDEFALLCPGDVAHGRLLGAQIRSAVAERLAGLGLGPRITVSVGVGGVRTTAEGAEPQSRVDRLAVVVEAAAALRSAKSHGRNRVEVYPGHVARQRERQLVVEAQLRDAITQGRITSVAQPIVDLRTGQPVAYESLARWDDEVLGAVPPSEFVRVAEESGLVVGLGQVVLRSAVAGFCARGLAGSGVRLAVNVSPLELRAPGYVHAVGEVLEEFRLPPQDLLVEVTEAVVIETGDPAVQVLGRLADAGIPIAIDDFGTGYSALGYLRRLPVHTLKVDSSLLSESLTSVRTRHILAGVIDLARRLRLPVIMEGIEDQPGAQLARELGAQFGQGFWLGRPTDWFDLDLTRRTPADGVRRPGSVA